MSALDTTEPWLIRESVISSLTWVFTVGDRVLLVRRRVSQLPVVGVMPGVTSGMR
ncbi:hypothetical protein D3C81_1321470 [compost metagenome]